MIHAAANCITACIVTVVLAATPDTVAADVQWPTRPVRIIVAQAPGGPPDLIARYVADKLSRSVGSPVVVENRPGASGIIGIEQAAHAVPDGYTLVIATLSTHALVPHVAVDAVLHATDTAGWAQHNGLEVATGSAASFADTVASDHARWGTLIRGMRLSPQ